MTEMLQSIGSAPLIIVLTAGAVAAVSDLRSFRIPNIITIPLLLLAFVFHAATPLGDGLAFALQGAVAGFACLILFYVLGGMGAGDVKFLAAAGAWFGPSGALLLFIVSALLMGVYAIVLTWRQGTLRQNLSKVSLIIRQGIVLVTHVGEDERVEEVVQFDTRRQRLIPFAAMVLGGNLLLVAAKFLGS